MGGIGMFVGNGSGIGVGSGAAVRITTGIVETGRVGDAIGRGGTLGIAIGLGGGTAGPPTAPDRKRAVAAVHSASARLPVRNRLA